MITIKKDTIIKKGDHLIETNGATWEVKDLEGLYFLIGSVKEKLQKQITKGELMADGKWHLVIMDKRNYW